MSVVDARPVRPATIRCALPGRFLQMVVTTLIVLDTFNSCVKGVSRAPRRGGLEFTGKSSPSGCDAGAQAQVAVPPVTHLTISTALRWRALELGILLGALG